MLAQRAFYVVGGRVVCRVVQDLTIDIDDWVLGDGQEDDGARHPKIFSPVAST